MNDFFSDSVDSLFLTGSCAPTPSRKFTLGLYLLFMSFTHSSDAKPDGGSGKYNSSSNDQLSSSSAHSVSSSSSKKSPEPVADAASDEGASLFTCGAVEMGESEERPSLPLLINAANQPTRKGIFQDPAGKPLIAAVQLTSQDNALSAHSRSTLSISEKISVHSGDGIKPTTELPPSGSESINVHPDSPPVPVTDLFSPTVLSNHRSMFTLHTSFAKHLPDHLHSLAHMIHELDSFDLAHIAYVTDRIFSAEVYSLLPYRGTNWFLPALRRTGEDECKWEVGYHRYEGLFVSIAGRRLSFPLLNLLVRLVLLWLIWLVLWFFIEEVMEPGGSVFDPVVLVLVSSVVGGLICRLLLIPPLAGVMWMAILWHNIPSANYLTSGISPTVLDLAAKSGLTVILAKAGYSISPETIIPHWRQIVMLATIPFLVEGTAGSLISNVLMPFNGEYMWAFLQGMLCAVGSPAVVIPAAHFLKDLGYKEESDKIDGMGPLSLMVSSIPLEIVLGVWCSNFLLSLLFQEQSLGIAIGLAPVQLICGAAVGIGIGYAFHGVVELLKREANRLPDGRLCPSHLRTSMNWAFALYMALCLVMVLGGYRLQLAGGGCIMCVSFCATVSYIWSRPRWVSRRSATETVLASQDGGVRGKSTSRGAPQHPESRRAEVQDYFESEARREKSYLTAIEEAEKEQLEELKEQKLYLGNALSELWDVLMMPVLFASMGTRIDLTKVFDMHFFPKAFGLLVIGTIIRFLCIMAVQLRSPLPWRRRLVVGIGYLGKASAQASIGPLAASMMPTVGAALWGPGGSEENLERYERYVLYSTNIQSISAMYVMFMAAFASIGVVRLGIVLLGVKKPQKAQKSKF